MYKWLHRVMNPERIIQVPLSSPSLKHLLTHSDWVVLSLSRPLWKPTIRHVPWETDTKRLAGGDQKNEIMNTRWLERVFSIWWPDSALEIGKKAQTSGCIWVRWLLLFVQSIWSGCLLWAFIWRFSGHLQLGGDPKANPRLAGGITGQGSPLHSPVTPRKCFCVLRNEQQVAADLT